MGAHIAEKYFDGNCVSFAFFYPLFCSKSFNFLSIEIQKKRSQRKQYGSNFSVFMGPGSLWYLAFCRSATFLCGLLSSKQPQVLEGLHFQQTCIFKKVFFSLFFRESKDLKILKPRDAMTASWRPFASGLYVPRRPKRNGIYTLFENDLKMSHFLVSKNHEN